MDNANIYTDNLDLYIDNLSNNSATYIRVTNSHAIFDAIDVQAQTLAVNIWPNTSNGTLHVGGSLYVAGAASISSAVIGNLVVSASTVLQGNTAVAGSIAIQGNLAVSGSFVNGNATIQNLQTTSGHVSGGLTVDARMVLAGGSNIDVAALSNNVSQQVLYGTTTGSRMVVIDGTNAVPSGMGNQPALFVQKYINSGQPTEHNQTVGGLFADVEIKGSGNANQPISGAFIGGMVSANTLGTNLGSSSVPAYDTLGDTIGFAMFASATGVPGNGHTITGGWSWAKGPSIDATTYAHLPVANWSLAGHEVNLTINHPDVADTAPWNTRTFPFNTPAYEAGNGSSVGLRLYNYRKPSTGLADWTFGLSMGGEPQNGDFGSTALSNYSGFHTGILVDKT
jgi:hypothetical protein